MHFSLTVFGFAFILPTIWADRGSAPDVVPTECNAAPTETSDPTSTITTPGPAPTCFYAADPDGGEGLCPNLSDGGWCDCGAAGTYSTLDSENVCEYSTLASSASIILSSTNCGTTITPTVVIITSTPMPTDSPSSPPSTSSRRRRSTKLRERAGSVTFDPSCGMRPPSGSSWGKIPRFTTMHDVLQAAYNDAVVLATTSQGVAANNAGFTHYFGGSLANVQLTNFQNMMKTIASGNYAVQFTCQDTARVCKVDSVMVTDATAGSTTDVKTITVCSPFWTNPSTRYLLYSSSPNDSGPTPPYRDDSPSGW